ncbi:MAG: putative leader peptide [Trebonia sp.]
MTDLGWTNSDKLCDPAQVSVTDPMLVARRHVDLLRVRSAMCRPAR